MALRDRTSNLIPYILVALAAIIGVYGISERTDSNIRNHLNEVVTQLCLSNIPRVQAESDLRDAQISVALAAYKLNIQQGDKSRAKLNQDTVAALKKAKRHVPTVKECNQKLF